MLSLILVGLVIYYIVQRNKKKKEEANAVLQQNRQGQSLTNAPLKTPQSDYSFGSTALREILGLLKQKNYPLAEQKIKALHPDELGFCISYVGLSMPEENYIHWTRNAEDKNVVYLFYGVFNSLQGWIARSHSYAKDVSQKNAMTFLEYIERSKGFYLQVEENSSMIIETYVRLAGYYKNYADQITSREYFEKVKAINPENISSYLGYASLIQPKWGGDIKKITEFLHDLPKRTLARQLVELMIALDSLTANTNYYEGTTDAEWKAKVQEVMVRIDKEISENPPTSIHKYTAYNTLMALGQELKNKEIESRNWKKMKGFYTFYPFGIQVK